MGLRRCEACKGPGPCLWADSGPNSQLYCCVQCHPRPTDPFFCRTYQPMDSSPDGQPPRSGMPPWLAHALGAVGATVVVGAVFIPIELLTFWQVVGIGVGNVLADQLVRRRAKP